MQGHTYREVQTEYTNNTPEYAHRIHTEYVMNKSSLEYGSEYSYNEQNTVWNTVHKSSIEYAVEYSIKYAAEYSHTEQNTLRIQLPKSSIEYAVEYSENTVEYSMRIVEYSRITSSSSILTVFLLYSYNTYTIHIRIQYSDAVLSPACTRVPVVGTTHLPVHLQAVYAAGGPLQHPPTPGQHLW